MSRPRPKSPPTLKRDAPAKVNLWLHILGRRKDGFHGLETRMARVSLCDELRFWTGCDQDKAQLTCSDSNLPVDDDNLILKAVRGVEAKLGKPLLGLHIDLDKRIPHGAGLGGGSSDAATTLLAVNELYELELGIEALAELAGEIGSDIPFFLYDGACDCSGRGEKVEVVKDFAGAGTRVLLVKPGFSVPTPWAYQQWKDSREIPGVAYAGQEHRDLGLLVNDLERPVFAKYVILADLKNYLADQPGVAASLMSGSGAVVYAVLDRDANAAELEARIHQEYGSETWVWTGVILP